MLHIFTCVLFSNTRLQAAARSSMCANLTAETILTRPTHRHTSSQAAARLQILSLPLLDHRAVCRLALSSVVRLLASSFRMILLHPSSTAAHTRKLGERVCAGLVGESTSSTAAAAAAVSFRKDLSNPSEKKQSRVRCYSVTHR